MSFGRTATARLTRLVGPLIAVGSIVAALGAQPVAAAAGPGPGRIVTGLTVISGSSSNISCPLGYEKNPTDLNHGSEATSSTSVSVTVTIRSRAFLSCM
jgi:hypothetical protein